MCLNRLSTPTYMRQMNLNSYHEYLANHFLDIYMQLNTKDKIQSPIFALRTKSKRLIIIIFACIYYIIKQILT